MAISRQAFELLRLQRHALANEVQLAAAWLELGRPERARESLTRLRARLAAEAELCRRLPAPLAAALLAARLRLEACGAWLDVELTAATTTWDEAAARRLVARLGRALRPALQAAARQGWRGLAATHGRPAVHVKVDGHVLRVRWQPAGDPLPPAVEVVVRP